MKIARTVAIAAVAAMALIALVGAGSASAADTTLCKTGADSPFCDVGDRYAAGTDIEASGKVTFGSLNMNGWLLKLSCDSALEAESMAETGEPLPIDIETWTLSGCTSSPLGSCTVAVSGTPISGELLWESGGKGTLYSEVNWQITCAKLGSCTLGSYPEIEISGGNPGTLNFSAQELSWISGPCNPSSVSGSHTVTSPTSLFVANTESPSLPEEGTIEAESGEVVISTHNFDFTCDSSSVALDTGVETSGELPVEITSFDLNGCGGGQYPECSVSTTIPAEGQGVIVPTGGGDGYLEDWAASWKFTCQHFGQFQYVTFDAPYLYAEIYGGGPATFSFEEHPIDCSGFLCAGEAATLSADFEVVSPDPLEVQF